MKPLQRVREFDIMWIRSLSITVSTTGFHPVNAGSTPAEITMISFIDVDDVLDFDLALVVGR